MPVQPSAVELLAALAPVAEQWGRWCVFDTPEHFARDMQAAGVSLRVSDPDLARRTRVMPFVHEPTGMPLDVVLAGSGLEDEFLQRAI